MAAPSGPQGRGQAPLLLLGVAVLIFGTGYWPTAVAAEHGPTLIVTFLRLITSALALLVIAVVLRARLPRGRLLGWAILTGLLMVALFHWGLTEAIARAGPGNTAILVNTNPLWVLVLAWIFLRERLSPIGILGLVTAFVGVVLMVSSQLGGSVETTQLLLGSTLALVAALSWAVGVLIVRSLSQQPGGIDMVSFTTTQFFVGSILLAPIALAIEGTSGTDWESGGFWAATMWTGPAAAFAALFFYVALKYLPAAKTSSALFLVPAVAVVVEIARGNTPSAVVLVGMLVAVTGVALAVMPREQLHGLVPFLRRCFLGTSTRSP